MKKTRTRRSKPKKKEEPAKPQKGGVLSEDQRERGYYYDDAHGYQDYEPDSETHAELEEEKD